MTVNIAFIHAIILKNLIVFLLGQNIQLYSRCTNRREGRVKEKIMYNNASELYNEYLRIYFNQ